MKDRKTPLMSKNKIVSAVNLYERFIDEPIENIKIWTSTSYYITGTYNTYSVDIKNNKVEKVYPDPEW